MTILNNIRLTPYPPHVQAVDAPKFNTGGTFTPPSQRVIAAVSRHTGVSGETLVGKSRLRPVVVARRITAYILRHRYGWSSTRIAQTLNRDHTTILTGLKRMSGYMTDAKYARQLSAVTAELQLGQGFIDAGAKSAAKRHGR